MVTEAVEALVAELASRDPLLAGSPEAALAVALAERIDDPSAKATAAANAASQLLHTLAALRALAPMKPKESPLDEIRARRDKKLADGPPAAKARVASAKRGKPPGS